jgi:putative transmembrane protein PGPGW
VDEQGPLEIKDANFGGGRGVKRVLIGLMGRTVLAIGAMLVILPGPGLPIIAAGLAILATEFFWARRAMRKAKGAVAKVRRKFGFREWLRRLRTRQVKHL